MKRPNVKIKNKVRNLRKKYEFAKQLRANPTRAESLLWERLKMRALGFKFKRQTVIRGWIVDFYCGELLLVIEVDGEVHDDPEVKAKDMYRQQSLERIGITVLRFKNEHVFKQIESVIRQIRIVTRLQGIKYGFNPRQRGQRNKRLKP